MKNSLFLICISFFLLSCSDDIGRYVPAGNSIQLVLDTKYGVVCIAEPFASSDQSFHKDYKKCGDHL